MIRNANWVTCYRLIYDFYTAPEQTILPQAKR